MVKQFLKIAGVKTQGEFYKKYPSEEAFFRAHPEARHLQKMSYGGIYAYQDGGSAPKRGDYGDNEEQYQADMDAYTASLGTGPKQGFVGPMPQTMIASQRAGLNPYQGVSIADMLAAQGKASDYSSRKQLAKTLGIEGYRGTADQNMQMMEMIKQNPNALTDYVESTIPASKTKRTPAAPRDEKALREFMMQEAQRQAADNPYIIAPVTTGPELPEYTFGQYNPGLGGGGRIKKTQPSKGMGTAAKVAIGTAGAAGAGAAGYGAYKEIKGIMDGINSGKFKPTGQLKSRLTKLRNEWLSGIGKNVKDQAEWFSKLPKEQQNILNNLDAMEISGDIHLMPHGTAARDMYTRDMLSEANAENLITSGKETEKALQEAAEESKALRSANARKAAAARWGTKSAKAAEAEKALGLGTRMMQGLRSIGEAKYVKPFAEGLRGFFEAVHAYGGQPVYQGGGSYNPTSVNYGPALPMFEMGTTFPEAMYGMGMAQGGQMPQWLAERRFAAAGNQHMMKDYGYARGGIVKGGEYEMTEDEIQDLINKGYKIEYL